MLQSSALFKYINSLPVKSPVNENVSKHAQLIHKTAIFLLRRYTVDLNKDSTPRLQSLYIVLISLTKNLHGSNSAHCTQMRATVPRECKISEKIYPRSVMASTNNCKRVCPQCCTLLCIQLYSPLQYLRCKSGSDRFRVVFTDKN